MTDYSTITKQEESCVTDSTDSRRRTADIAQPLDYVTKEPISEFVVDQRRTSPSPKSFIQKLFKRD